MQRVFSTLIFAFALAVTAAAIAPARGDSFTTITSPIKVPLQWTNINGSTTERKLGIYVTLGGGTMPQLFEFDTGGDGFYATHDSGTPAKSPWWGGGWTTAGTGTFSQNYDSGMQYSGTAVTTTVNLFASGSATVPLLTAVNAVIGQTVSISNTNSPSQNLWPLPSGTSQPPVDQAFWGDFGMAPKQGQAGIDSLAGQLLYGPGVTPGFRVHAAGESPWVQFGLSNEDTAMITTTFALNLATGSSAAGVAYYENLVVTGSLSVTDGAHSFAQPTGFIFDTGATTTIHNGTNSVGQKITLPPDLTKDGQGAEVKDGALVLVSGSSLMPGGGWTTIMNPTIGPGTNIGIQDKNAAYYLNTGIAPFLTNDFVYNLAGQQLSIVPVPEPSAALLAAVGVLVAAAARRRLRKPRSR